MKTKLWLDDLRPAPDDSWQWLRSGPGAIHYIEALASLGLSLELISFDHDLGYRGQSAYLLEEHDSRMVMTFIEERVVSGEMQPPDVEVHTANPAGRRWLELAAGALERLSTRF